MTTIAKRYIAWVSLDNKDLACAEIKELLKVKPTQIVSQFAEYAAPKDHLITFEATGNTKLWSRLSYTKNICEILVSTPRDKIHESPKQIAKKINTPSYRVDFFNSMHELSKKEMNFCFASLYLTVKKPKVNLKSPATFFVCYFTENDIIFAKQIWANDYEYEKRPSHLRERSHAAVMPPKLVRVMINLTGLKTGIINDPFCGTAGILIEAMHCGFKVSGSDIDSRMVSGARINITNEIKKNPAFVKYCDPKKDIAKESATIATRKCDAIVTDLPYGKNTKKLKSPTLYKDFLNHVYDNNLCKKMVICFPSFAKAKEIIAKTSWIIIASNSDRIHNSLNREIYVLARDK